LNEIIVVQFNQSALFVIEDDFLGLFEDEFVDVEDDFLGCVEDEDL